MYPEDQYAVRSLKAGASGYMVKEGAPKSLVRAIRKILKGEKYISPVLAEKLVSYLDAETDKPPHETLSNREHQTMIMMASGKTIKEISQELCLSAKTISTYRDRIFKKMKIKRSVELVHYAIKHGLIDQ
jgi:DNA-binding NarL/FixJ family response regulator